MRLLAEAVAHGGHCVARHDGQVVFVRGALPGETVDVQVTHAGRRNRYLFADVVEVIDASPHRVQPPCPFAGPGRCGGCDWQHADLAAQRDLKAQVLAEQLLRLGGVTGAVEVLPVAGDRDGLAWRTAVRYAVSEGGSVGFRRHRSHDVQTIDRCLIASEPIQDADVTAREWPAGSELVVTEDGLGGIVVAPDGVPPGQVERTAVGRRWQVPVGGFWQVHPGAADALAARVVAAVADRRRVWDLYAGVGLFAGALAAADRRRQVVAVEASKSAVVAAERNLADLDGVRVVRADVLRWLRAGPPGPPPDAVVLDPPRKGAGAAVLGLLDATPADLLVLVACDPSALGRDVGWLRERDWSLQSVTGLDLFPMTHHIEAVAVLARSGPRQAH